MLGEQAVGWGRQPDGARSTRGRIPIDRQIIVRELPVNHDLAAVR